MERAELHELARRLQEKSGCPGFKLPIPAIVIIIVTKNGPQVVASAAIRRYYTSFAKHDYT